ncbi:MAG TPA: tetratricopeptide repeat protein [Spirochaetota bacterium]|nr:tetratricopeptide repeat protein [Spirochaetota bacterium]HOS33144.1 tetratricopeptide repeat protein [Spirochaetota bacterium]HOS54514.1 tetratricopeptide repeat protein [Spirochaetota bacterium]HPK61076.1 tetratricopeptide repeat protein [Spirochaetota bacterium]HQF77156.1 tetratricopeptide repeat protein [Spirochaetota bacterium]
MKKLLLISAAAVMLSGCYGDPLFLVRRMARSDDIEKKMEASRQYRQAIDILTDAYNSYGGLNRDIGQRLMMNRNYALAIKHLELAKEVRTNDGSIYYWLAVCYVNLLKIENKPEYMPIIDNYYQNALNITPDNKEFLYAYAQFLVYGSEDYDKAIETLKKYIVLLKSSFYADAYFLLGRAYYMLERYEEALRVYNELYAFEKKLTKEQIDKLDEFTRTVKELIQ